MEWSRILQLTILGCDAQKATSKMYGVWEQWAYANYLEIPSLHSSEYLIPDRQILLIIMGCNVPKSLQGSSNITYMIKKNHIGVCLSESFVLSTYTTYFLRPLYMHIEHNPPLQTSWGEIMVNSNETLVVLKIFVYTKTNLLLCWTGP